MGATKENMTLDRKLQRGRACEGAEIRAADRRRREPIGRFNGAAPVRARKSALEVLIDRMMVALQRGRACEGAEMQAVT